MGESKVLHRLIKGPSAQQLVQLSREERAHILENRLLLKSLLDHTRGYVRWEALDEWADAWDTCVKEIFPKLRREARKVLENLIAQQNLKGRLLMATGQQMIDDYAHYLIHMEEMVHGVLHIAWQMILANDMDLDLPLLQPQDDGTIQLTFSKELPSLIFRERNLAEEEAEACKSVAKTLYKGDAARVAAEQVRIMAERQLELEEALAPIRLRSILLKARCDLCPV